MKEFELSLKMFREERNLLIPNLEVTKKMVSDELDEVLDAKTWNHAAEEMCDVCVVMRNYLAQKGARYIEDAHIDKSMKDIDDAVKFCRACLEGEPEVNWIIDAMRDCITLNGYDFDKAMLETAKKINSREGAMDELTGKWTKNANQHPDTLYIPDYDKCKI